MDVYETRHENLLFLLDKYQQTRGDSAMGLLVDFGKLVGVSDRQLSHLKVGRRNLGSNTARKIEKNLGLEAGWMDKAHNTMQPVTKDEQKFLDVVLALYRESPVKAQEAILEAIKERLCSKQEQQDGALSRSTSRKR